MQGPSLGRPRASSAPGRLWKLKGFMCSFCRGLQAGGLESPRDRGIAPLAKHSPGRRESRTHQMHGPEQAGGGVAASQGAPSLILPDLTPLRSPDSSPGSGVSLSLSKTSGTLTSVANRPRGAPAFTAQAAEARSVLKPQGCSHHTHSQGPVTDRGTLSLAAMPNSWAPNSKTHQAPTMQDPGGWRDPHSLTPPRGHNRWDQRRDSERIAFPC